jgi:two-component system nitrate/nitrite response regulator NarL
VPFTSNRSVVPRFCLIVKQQSHNELLYGRDRTTVLVSEASKMHCDLLSLAFDAVRQRIQVVASASNTAEILALLPKHRPHVAIISAKLEDGPLAGVQILPEVRRTNPDTRILVLLESSDREVVTESFRFGADGVFCRNNPFDQLYKSVDVVSQGQIWANSTELRYILDEFTRAPKPLKMHSIVEHRMTAREAEVTRLAVEGLSNREIAQQLRIAEHTVKNYLFKIFDKLGVSNRVELVLSCLRQEEAAREESCSDESLAL